ncbi:sulfotransferase domain-containing protein [Ekhidna sp. To15]|uniref:sulfotransferase domain-containing protein n=1 Tax=Ekhidna sp. To15 TaxID=3395267 RepID=UPI003F51C9A1
MALPNFIIAGPPKTGTTSLFDWLAGHPDVLPSKVKETYYFYEDANKQSPYPNFNKDGWKKYEEYFSGHSLEKVLMEASPGYIYSSLAAKNLSTLNDLKVIIVYRPAADRLFSEYQFNRFKTKKFKGSFEEYLEYDGTNFLSQSVRESVLTPFVNLWLNHVKEDQFRIITFEELKSSPIKVLKKLATFLAIDSDYFETSSLNKKNETFGLRNRKLHEIALTIKSWTPKAFQNLLTPIYYSFNKTSVPKKSQDEIALKKRLSEHLANEEHTFRENFNHLFL